MNLIFENSFVVFPKDTNYNPPMVFGGKILAEMDITAACCARRLLYDSHVKDAVTVAVNNVSFFIGAEVKDLIFLRAEVKWLGVKSIDMLVTGERESHINGSREKICCGNYRFVSYDLERRLAVPHGLMLPYSNGPLFPSLNKG